MNDQNSEFEQDKELIRKFLEFELNESLSEQNGHPAKHEALGVLYSEIINAFNRLDTNYRFFD